ncbi:NPCBM/NEW2 domain-containing protein [Actinoplanes sp. CA-030573]|uniref:NPCBM/NEW2 domain-containing protein n=1 Tax=Actinoplanes sp. CA-030573 TaxID=3239898 RepID=UPI003D93657E
MTLEGQKARADRNESRVKLLTALVTLVGAVATAFGVIWGVTAKRADTATAQADTSAVEVQKLKQENADLQNRLAAAQKDLEALRASASSSDPGGGNQSSDQVQTSFLTDLQYVDYDHKASTGYYRADGPYEANGKDYPHGIAMSSGCQNRDGGDYWVDFNLGRSYTRLVGDVALEDSNTAGVEMKYQLMLDGVSKAGKALTAGNTSPIDVDVTDGLRLRLLVHDPRRTSCGAEGHAYVIWGDLRLTGKV